MLTKNVDPDKKFYSEYGISFDARGTFSLQNSGFGKNVIIFSADKSSSLHVDNKKYILILGKAPTQGLDDTKLTAEAEYSINFTKKERNFV